MFYSEQHSSLIRKAKQSKVKTPEATFKQEQRNSMAKKHGFCITLRFLQTSVKCQR
jgi:hypothetical protein